MQTLVDLRLEPRWLEPIPSRLTGGAFRDRHGRWVRDAVDALAAQDGRGSKPTATSCGPDISTLMSTPDNASHGGGMVTRKSDHQGEREGNR